MIIDFSHGTVSLVLVRCDMRFGFAKLSSLVLFVPGSDLDGMSIIKTAKGSP